jgi:hypothetical protein
MIISFEQVGLFLQIIGVLIVLLSQAWFGYRTWRRFRGLRRTFMGWIGPVRMGAGETEGKSDEYLKKTFPELWAFASYLREDLWTTVIGLVITLIGLICELSSLALII